MFDDRSQAGRVLGRMVARRIARSPQDSPVVVLALPRGGVPVAVEVARSSRCCADLDVFLVRKLGVPDREELAFGAIASGGVRVYNRIIIEEAGLSAEDIERVAAREQIELVRRERIYRLYCGDRAPVEVRDRVAILVDDGLATGATMLAAVRAVRLLHPKRIVVAAPVASVEAGKELRDVADEVICAETPEPFFAVGYWYRDFDQVSDEEVGDLLRGFRPTPA
jgi:putative phosphoribosyl transferase